jgi:hypothetical protein
MGEWDRIWKVFQKKHGPLAEYVPATLNDDRAARRDHPLSGLRSLKWSIASFSHCS